MTEIYEFEEFIKWSYPIDIVEIDDEDFLNEISLELKCLLEDCTSISSESIEKYLEKLPITRKISVIHLFRILTGIAKTNFEIFFTHWLVEKLNGSEFSIVESNRGKRPFALRTVVLDQEITMTVKSFAELLTKKELLSIIIKAKKLKTLVFIDECFIELVPDYDESVISYVKKYDNLFILRSLTKSFGLPGIRIGYACGSKEIIKILQKIKIPWSVNSIAQDAANEVIKNKSHITKSKFIIKKELKYLNKLISSIDGFECIPSSTNFILIKTKYNSTYLQKKLLKNKILIRDCKNFRGLNEHYFRIAVKSHRDNVKLVSALESIK